MVDARRQIDQTVRRVVEEETIPYNEKVFSIFEPHTEWIVKGKAGVPVELGLRVCIMEDSAPVSTSSSGYGEENRWPSWPKY